MATHACLYCSLTAGIIFLLKEDEDGWILFSAHTAEKTKNSTSTGSESQQRTKGAFKDVRQTEIQTESPVFSVQSAEFSTPPIPPPVPKSMTKRSLARYHQVEPITPEVRGMYGIDYIFYSLHLKYYIVLLDQ